MMNCFEDVKREVVNGHPFATNYDDFVRKMLSAIQEVLNSPAGQDLIRPLREEAIRIGMDPEMWSQHKANVMQVLFFLILEECPQLKHEMSRHLYNELRKEVSP